MSPAMQSRVTTSRSTRGRSAWNEEEEVDFKANATRYRVLDAEEKKRETEDVERTISELKAQRRRRSVTTRKQTSSSEEAPVVPIPSGSPRLKRKGDRVKSARLSSTGHSFGDNSGGDELLPGQEQNPLADAVSQSFQDQVLEELRKLKEAQRMEFEALERLQREKEDAERKARRLEEKLRDQRRQLARNEAKTARSFEEERRTKSREDILLPEDSGSDEENNDFNPRAYGGAGTEEEEPELIGWDDEAKSPPPYFTTASPATSPFKRSGWIGDESLPPGPRSEPDAERNSSELTKPRSKLETSRSRPSSARSSHVRRLSPSRSRSPSATRPARSTHGSQELRRSGAFFEDKARAQAEAAQRAKEAAERLERARHAAPPQKLLERQAVAQQRRSQQLEKLEREMNAQLAREKRAKARDVPLTTYLSATDAEDAEQKRKERIRKRAQELMQAAELPPRMEVASKNEAAANGQGAGEVGHMSVKRKKKLRAAAEEEAQRRKRRPKPVPNFEQLHSQWEAALKKRKELARRNQDEEEGLKDAEASSKKKAEFFTSRAAELAQLQAKKQARKARLQAKEEAIQQHAKRAQEKLLARARASLGNEAGSQRKPTKAETLRVQKLLTEAAKLHKERQREEGEADARERRREEAARRVRAQVKRSENVRRDNYAGTIVDLKDLDAVAKEKAREQRQHFKEAIARNKEKLLAAAAARPSLMERFTTGVKRETHRRAALEAVVKTVFQKDLSALKGVLTDDEQELAREMVAADDNDDKASKASQ